MSFLLAFVLQVEPASAAPSGMCSPSAQSIAAPSPIYPAGNAQLLGCDAEPGDMSADAETPGTPSEHFAPRASSGDSHGVLTSSVDVQDTRGPIRTIEPRQNLKSDEHRRQNLRPPTP